MAQYRVITQDRQYFCDAADPEAARAIFRVNIEGLIEADLDRLCENGALINVKTDQSFPVTVHLPRAAKPAKRKGSR